MMDWERVSKLLSESLDKHIVKTRTGGGGKQLSYIDHFAAIDTANRIFGHGGWSRHTVLMRQVSDKPVAYMAKVRVTVGDVIRDGYGYGNGFGNDAHELAIKEAETDATKRALMTFGYPLGLALYQKEGEREHVTDGGASESEQEAAPVVGKVIRLPTDDSNNISAARSKGSWDILIDEMLRNGNCEDLNQWYVEKQPQIKKMSNSYQWMFFEELIKRGLDLCPTGTDMGQFWISHKSRLEKLKDLRLTTFQSLEDYMAEKFEKIANRAIEEAQETTLAAG